MTHKDIPLNERIIFALDVGTIEEAEIWVKRLESHIRFFKVGLQLFLGGWFPVVEMIRSKGHKVMLDLKFYDIPETVRLAVSQLRNRGIAFATVHGNAPIIKAAVQEKDDVKLLAVTVLTSIGEEEAQAIGFKGEVEDLVLLRAKHAVSLGCDGIVCSGLEARRLRAELGDDFCIITPGIRPAGNTADDQKRVMTARQAIANGADYIVVGRPIRDAQNPVAVIEGMQEEIRKCLA
ncbi:MAG: orotidine-5'-phosphate decarboxylase [Pseudomonadota bacterium]